LAVSLFPFLAVLICTLGVLIVLLVLAVKVADSNATTARSEAAEERNSQLNEVQLQLEERQIQIDGLKQVRPEALERLEEARSTRSHFEEEFRQLRSEARSLAEALLQLEDQRHGIQAKDVSEDELEKLETQIEKAKSSLAAKREQAKQAPEEVWSIQPYRGKSGTHRRPIFGASAA
jgi:chromosome segregation ATPase